MYKYQYFLSWIKGICAIYVILYCIYPSKLEAQTLQYFKSNPCIAKYSPWDLFPALGRADPGGLMPFNTDLATPQDFGCTGAENAVYSKLEFNYNTTSIRIFQDNHTFPAASIALMGLTDACPPVGSTNYGEFLYQDANGVDMVYCADPYPVFVDYDISHFTPADFENLYLWVSSPPPYTEEFIIYVYAFIAPPNNDCSSALDLGQLSKSGQLGTCDTLPLQSNSYATSGPTYGGSCYSNFSTGATVWYSFTTGQDVDHISIDVNHHSNGDLNFALLELPSGCGPPPAKQEVFNLEIDGEYCTSVSNGLDSLSQLPVLPNTQYYLVVNTPFTDTGSFDLCVKSCAGPPNDKICSAEPVIFHSDPNQFISRSGNTNCASIFLLDPATKTFTNFDCPVAGTEDPYSAVFYKLDINPFAKSIEINGSNFSGTNKLAAQIFYFDDESQCPGSIYTVSKYSQPTSGSCDINGERLTLDLCNIDPADFDDLYLYLGTERDDQGTFDLSFNQKIGPRNDECIMPNYLDGATNLPATCINLNNVFACSDDIILSQPPANSSDLPCFVDNPALMNSAGVWFEFQTQSNGELLDLSVSHSNMQDVIVALFKKDPDCSNLQPILCREDDNMDGIIADISDYLIEPNESYLIYLYTDQSIAGVFDLCYDIKEIPPCEGSAPRYFNQTTPICDLTSLDYYCLEMTNTPVYPNLSWPNCDATLHDPNWFTFVAGSNNLELEIEVLYCINNDGVQIEMYELPCNYELGPAQDPVNADPNILGTPLAGCQYVHTPQLGTVTFSVNTKPGSLYGIVIDGWGGDLCHVEVNVRDGDDPPILDVTTLNPPTYQDQGLGFVADTICAGAMDVPFIRNGEVEGACWYLWSVDGNYLPSQTSDSLFDISFDIPGIYEVCVSASTYCDTTGPVCTEVLVMDIPAKISRDTVCEGANYSWYGPSGQLFGEYGPFFNTGLNTFQYSLMNSYGCDVPYELQLYVRNENEENPSPLDTFTCFNELPFDLFGTIIHGPVSDQPIQSISQFTSCDTFFSADVYVFGGNFFLKPTCYGQGDVEFIVEWQDDPTLYTPWSEQLQIFQNYPDFSLEYEWSAIGHGFISDEPLSLTLLQTEIEDLAVGGVFTLQLRLIMSYKGEMFCISTSQPFEYSLLFNFPEIIDILGNALYCPGQGDLKLFSHTQDPIVPDVGFPDPVTFYRWYPPAGFTVEPPSSITSDTLLLRAPVNPSDNTLCLTITTGSCMYKDSLCIDLEVDTPAQPVLEPNNETCNLFWTFTPSFAENGQWQVIGTSDSVHFSNINDPNATVTVSEPGSYTFSWREGPANCALFDTVTIDFNGAPQLASYSDTCYSGNNFVISLELQDSTSNFSIDMASSISGNIQGNKFVSDTIPISSDPLSGNYGDTLYLVVVNDKGCVSDSIPIVLFCGCQSKIGQMSKDTLMGCENEFLTANYTGGHYNDGNDTLMFVLHTGNSRDLGVVLDSSRDSRFLFNPSRMILGNVYFISMVIGNARGGYVDLSDPCLKIAEGQAVIWHEQAVVHAGNDTSVCEYKYQLLGTSSVGEGRWEVTPYNSEVVFSDAENPTTQVTVENAGSYTFRWFSTNTVCSDSDEVDVTFYGDIQALTTTNCNEEATKYDLKIVLSGGGGDYIFEELTSFPLVDSPYLLADTIFCKGIPKDSIVSFIINNDLGCGPLQFDVTTSCECETAIGSLSGSVLLACPDACIDSKVLTYDPGGQFLDGNDTLSWILHTSRADTLLETNFIAQSPDGEFCYDQLKNSIILGDTIYISRIAGNHIGGGEVDIHDACHQITAGMAVVFKDAPEAIVTPEYDSLNCSQTSVSINGEESNGEHLKYFWTSDNNGTILGPNNESAIIAGSPGIYTLTVVDTLTGCMHDTSISIYNSGNIPEVSILAPDTLNCKVSEIILDGSLSTSGPGISYLWTGPGIVPPFDQNTVRVNASGTYTLNIINEFNQCEASTTIEVIEDKVQPIAQAQVEGQLSCSTTEINLNANGSSVGSNYSYRWSTTEGNIIGNTNTPIITVNKAGDYLLEVSNNSNGCVDSSIAIVAEITNSLSKLEVNAQAPECHNENNGRITIQAEGGIPPIQYRIIGVDTNHSGQFIQLGAGTYFIELEDTNGCRLRDTITLENPPLLSIDISESVLIKKGDTVVIEAVLPPGVLYDTLIWDTDFVDYHCLDLTCTTIRISPPRTTEVIATVIGGVGCVERDEMQITVEVIEDLYIPNVFSPNDDGINDVFLPESGSNVARIKNMQIFDRWGNLVFESRNFEIADRNFGWDGSWKGHQFQPAIFVYRIEVEYDDGQHEIFHGSVFLSK